MLLVLLFHFDLGELFRAGFVGVDIFFVISGYLIGSIIRKQLASGTFSASDFYTRRIRRLAPALLATIFLTAVVGWVVLTPSEMQTWAKEGAAAQLYVSNFYYWRFLSYFGLQAKESPFLHTWSLAVEEQFYVAFPFALWAAWKLRRNVVPVLIVIAAASFASNVLLVYWKPALAFYLLPTRAWEFACGALVPEIAAIIEKWRVPRSWLAAVGVVGLVAALAIYGEDMHFPGVYAAAPVVATVALLIAGMDPASWYSRAVGARTPVYLGRISYELYLVHWPVRVFAPMLLLDYSLTGRLACFALCIPLASLIHHGVGVPLRTARVARSKRTVVLGYAGATAAFVAVSAAVALTGGFPERLTAQSLRLASFSNDASAAYRRCEDTPMGTCLIGSPGVTPSSLVYGDSHADALAGAFDATFKRRRQAAVFAFKSGCLPVVKSGKPGCRAFNQQALRFVDAHPAITSVVLVSTWRQPLETPYWGRDGIEGGAAALKDFAQSLSETIEHHRARGRHVVVWMPVPGARKSVPPTLARNLMLHRQWDIRYTRTEYAKTFAFLTTDLNHEGGVTLIRPARFICSTGVCALFNNGRPLYHDDAHPAASQMPFYGEIIDTELPVSAGPR